MPSRKFALDAGGSERLTIKWRLFSEKRIIYLDGKPIGQIPNRKALKEGRQLRLPDGSKLTIRQKSEFAIDELQLLKNGIPLPDSDSDPYRRIKAAAQVLFFLAGLNLVYALLLPNSYGLNESIVEALITGLIYLVLGVFVRHHSIVAIGLALLGFIIDYLFLAWVMLNGGGFSIIAILVRTAMMLYLARGARAIRDLNRSAAQPSPKTNASGYRSFLDDGESRPVVTSKKGILEDLSRHKLGVWVAVGMVMMVVLGIVIGLFVTGRFSQSVAVVPTAMNLPRIYSTSTPVFLFSPTPSLTSTPTLTPTPLPPNLVISWSFRVIDAEYSASLDRIIAISTAPDQLHIYDPMAQQDHPVVLSAIPICVSVSPDGKFAAVGHRDRISYIDLQSGGLVKNLNVSYPVVDIVLANNGWVYAVAEKDLEFSPRYLLAVEISTNQEVLADETNTDVLKLSEDERHLYSSGYHALRIDINVPPLGETQEIWPTYREYFFLSDDGLRLFERSGDVWRISEGEGEILSKNGHLEGIGTYYEIRHMTYIPSLGMLLVLKDDRFYGRDEVVKYQYDPLTLLESWKVPDIVEYYQAYPVHGRFIFANAAGSQYYIIVQADPSAGMLNDYGLVIGHLDGTPGYVMPK